MWINGRVNASIERRVDSRLRSVPGRTTAMRTMT
jgi:hypothetical protein